MDFIAQLPLSPLGQLANGQAFVAAAIFARLSALFFFLPGVSERVVSIRIRLVLALTLMLILLPVVEYSITPPTSLSSGVMIIAAEAISGALLGFTIRIAIFALQTAGSMISQSLSLQQLFGSTVSSEMETPISTILLFGGIVLALTAGIHIEAVGVLILSFDVIPLGQFPGANDTGQWSADRAGFAFAAALSMAAPFVVLGFVYNLVLGAANRAMPQLMVAFVGVPAITLAGLALLAACTPILLAVWLDIQRDVLLQLLDYYR